MASDTSLVFNLIARDHASETLSTMKEKFSSVSQGLGIGIAGALGVGVAANLDMTSASAKLTAQLGVGPAKAAELSKVSADIYANAWGDSTADVSEAIKSVYQNIGDTKGAQGGLEGITTRVMALSDTFDQDLGGVTAAVGQMMKTGLAKNADEAMDIITKGFQKGNDKAGDLLDTFNEYGVQFHSLGLDGQTAMGLISQGLKGGARDADLVADSLKEFNLRARDITSTAPAGFKALGLNAKQMAADVAAGGPRATHALQTTLDALRKYPDSSKKASLAAAIFGTQSEDMQKALMSLDPSHAVDALGKVSGAAQKMTDTVGNTPASALESLKRHFETKLGSIAGTLVKFGTDNAGVVVPLASAFATLAVAVVAARTALMVYETVTGLVTAAQTIMEGSTYRTIAAWVRMNAIGVAAYVRIGASAVASAAATAAAWVGSALTSIGTYIASVVRAAVTSAAQYALMAARAVVWAAIMAAQWLIAIWPIALVVVAVVGLAVVIYKNWDKIKKWTAKIWSWIWEHIKSIAKFIWNLFLNWTIYGQVIKHWSAIKSGTLKIWNAVVGFVRGLPGKIASFFRNWSLPGIIAKHWGQIKSGSIRIATSLVSWVRGLPGRIVRAVGNLGRLLYGAGKSIIQGLINGIKNMAGNVSGAVKSVLSSARKLLPFSPAKEGPFSGKGWTLYSGQSLMGGLAKGIASKRGATRQAMSAALRYVHDAPAGRGGAAVAGASRHPIYRDQADMRPLMASLHIDGKTLAQVLIDHLRGEIQHISGGSVQKALGRGTG